MIKSISAIGFLEDFLDRYCSRHFAPPGGAFQIKVGYALYHLLHQEFMAMARTRQFKYRHHSGQFELFCDQNIGKWDIKLGNMIATFGNGLERAVGRMKLRDKSSNRFKWQPSRD